MVSWSPLSLCLCWLSIAWEVIRAPRIVPEGNLSVVVWVVVGWSVEKEAVPPGVTSSVAVVTKRNVVLYGWSSRRLAVSAF